MRKLLAVGRKELRQLRRDRRSLLILVFLPAFFLPTRTIKARPPPLAKNSWTAWPRVVSPSSPPNTRSYSAQLVIAVGLAFRSRSHGPCVARPMKAATEVGAPSMARATPRTSST